jgi:hypothetical protein
MDAIDLGIPCDVAPILGLRGCEAELDGATDETERPPDPPASPPRRRQPWRRQPLPQPPPTCRSSSAAAPCAAPARLPRRPQQSRGRRHQFRPTSPWLPSAAAFIVDLRRHPPILGLTWGCAAAALPLRRGSRRRRVRDGVLQCGTHDSC